MVLVPVIVVMGQDEVWQKVRFQILEGLLHQLALIVLIRYYGRAT